jgi:phosphoribosylformimino-5-aminoimidazole carboxamide ribotide isomerase
VILYPAIDIRDGRAVRLLRGEFDRETVYDTDPVDAASRWAEGGARFLHVVDLDGAREGRPANLDHVRRIAAAVEVPIQLGGGLRDPDSVGEAFAAGAARVVLGTSAVTAPELVAALVAEHSERIVVSVDTREGLVAVSGWERETESAAEDLIAGLSGRGVARFVYTPVDVDGTLEGPELDALRRAAGATGGELIYSGGIGSLDDVRAIAALRISNLGGVIVGRALYEGRFGVAEGQRALDAG